MYLAKSSTSCGGISPRNCFAGGQETNCRINNLILEASKGGEETTLWFYRVDGGKDARVEIEALHKNLLKPPWNL